MATKKNRGCIDHLTNLENYIREGFIKKEHIITIFFDLEKAYDTTWKFGIIKDLYDLKLRGRLPKFIKNFLTDGTFQVRIGSALSDLIKELSPDIYGSLYVDDCSISYKSKYIPTLERKLQHNINKIRKWATENGFKFSKTKTKCIHFCNQQKLHNNPTLTIEKKNIPFVDQHKHLGLIFDKKLNFILHINYIKTKCNKALQLLHVIAHTNWGADKNNLSKLYRSLIRSKIDYSCFIYQSARKSYLKSLNPVHHTGLRLALGAFKTTPVESLYAEANEPPPKLRCNNLALKYYTKLKADLNNPAHNSTFYPKYKNLFQKNENSIKTFRLRMEPIYKEAALPVTKIHKTTLFKTPKNRLESLQTQQKSHPPNNIPRKIPKSQRKISQLHPYLH